jgi:hypothetical protein
MSNAAGFKALKDKLAAAPSGTLSFIGLNKPAGRPIGEAIPFAVSAEEPLPKKVTFRIK